MNKADNAANAAGVVFFLFTWLMTLVLSLGIPVAVVLVIIHFARKFW